MERIITSAIEAALKAGEEILKVYKSSDFEIELKENETPLTLADRKAHDCIESYLKETQIPILSEEGKEIHFSERSHWNKFWLVDPLDGTKEFINKNGEFTVNIALIENQQPITGVIYVPVKRVLYYNTSDGKAFKLSDVDFKNFHSILAKAETLTGESHTDTYTVVGSRSFMNDETKRFIDKLKSEKNTDIKFTSVGSSLKFCLLAEGTADYYPRMGPTMEWDTAAGHSIVKACGFTVLRADNNKELLYNKQDLLNPYFIVQKA